MSGTAFFIFFSGAAGAGIITAGLWFYAVEVHPGTVSQAKTGTFVNELFIFGLFINKASTKFNESLVRRGAGLKINDIQSKPFCCTEPGGQFCPQ